MNLFRNFLRTFIRNRQSTWLNMLGLVSGLACCLLIMLWISFQYRTDRFYPEAGRIVTVSGYHVGSQPFRGAPPAVAPVLASELPEIESYARLCWAAASFKVNGEQYDRTAFDTDPGFFTIFGCDFSEGTMFAAGETQKCVLTESAARELFGESSALGQYLEFDFGKFAVSGIIRDFPKNTTVGQLGDGPGVFLPISRNGEKLDAWYNNSFETYFRLKDPVHMEQFKEKIKNRAYEAQPEYDLYLESDFLVNRGLYRYGNIKGIRLMGIIALVVMLIACINFINLSTANFTKSSFQTGLRKILGASRRSLVLQQIFNTFLIVSLSFLLAVGVSILIFPFFNSMLEQSLELKDLFTGEIIWIGCCIVLGTTLLAGFYPAIYISSFKPLSALRDARGNSGWNARIRQSLVILQFCISIVLIISTLVISRQIRMYHDMDLGYVYNEVMYVSLRNDSQMKKATALRDELRKNPKIRSVSLSVSVPSQINWNGVGWGWEGKDPNFQPLISFNYADENWSEVYGLKYREGGFFSDSLKGVVINQKMLELMNVTDGMDKFIERGQEKHRVLGVLDNTMFNNFKAESQPIIIFPLEEWISPQIVNIRASGNMQTLYDEVMTTAETVFGEKPIVRFLDYNINSMLTSERETSKMVSSFSMLAIIISCLGLFGLATFMIEQKKKEIGIRRVNGARVREIIWLLNIGFVKPVMIGFLVACPIAYYLMRQWLEGYTRHTELNLWIFLSAGLITLFIAVATLIWRTWHAATENPVKALKGE